MKKISKLLEINKNFGNWKLSSKVGKLELFKKGNFEINRIIIIIGIFEVNK